MTAAAAPTSVVTEGGTLFEGDPGDVRGGGAALPLPSGLPGGDGAPSPPLPTLPPLAGGAALPASTSAMGSLTVPGNMLQSTTVTDYDLGGEGDLFKAPEPIIEEPFIDLYPVAAAISMMSNGDDVIAAEAIECVDIDSIQNEQPLSEVFYECKKDLLAKSVIEDTFSALLDVKIPALQIEEVKMVQNEKLFGDGSIQEEKMVQNEKVVGDGPIQKSVSSSCLTSLDWSNGGSMRPTFLDFQGMDLEAVFGMRRVYSEGDIQTVGNGNISLHPSFERMFSIGDYKIEERRQQLSRYRRKKTERNFGRKIKYACRKALADSQPRVRGRFAKTEDCEIAKTSK